MRIPLPGTVCPLSRAHDRSQFDCGVELLNRYLRQQARQEMERHVGVTFVFPDSKQIVRGFYTLSSSSIAPDQLPPVLAKKLPRYGHLPVTLLGRLAVDRLARSKGLGQYLLSDALRRSLDGSRVIGAMAIIVDAKDQQAGQFYQHFGFLSFQSTPRRLFLPMQQIAALFAGGD